MTDALTEFTWIDPEEMHLVGMSANGVASPLLAKAADALTETSEELLKEFVDGLCGLTGCDVCHERYTALKDSDGFLEKARLKAKQRNALSESDFAFPKQRKEPLNDASHVRAAMARFNQTEGVTAEEKEQAKHRILARAKELGIDVSDKDDVSKETEPHDASEVQTHADPMAPEPASPSVDATDAQGEDGKPREVAFPHPAAGDGQGDTAPDKSLPTSESESQTREDPATKPSEGGNGGAGPDVLKAEEDMTGDHQEDKDVDPSAEESQTREVGKATPGSPEWEKKDVALGEKAEALANELKEVIQTFTEREKAEGGVSAKQAYVISGVKQLLDNPALLKGVAQMSMSAADVLAKLGDDDNTRRAEEIAVKAEKKAFKKAVKKEAKKMLKKQSDGETVEDTEVSKTAETEDISSMSKKKLAKQVAQLSEDLAKMSAGDGKRIPLNSAGAIAITRGQIERDGAENVFKMFDDRIADARSAHESATTPMAKERAWRDYQLAQRQRLLAKMVSQESTGDPNTVRKGSKYGPDFTPIFAEGSTFSIGEDEGLSFTHDPRSRR